MAFLEGAVFAVLFICLLFVIRLYIVVTTGSTHQPGIKGPVAVLVVAGSGGHTAEILRLMECLSAAYTPRHYVIADTDRMSEEKICNFESPKRLSNSVSQFTICRIPRSREVHQSWSFSVISTLNALWYSLPLVFRLRPDMQVFLPPELQRLDLWLLSATCRPCVPADNCYYRCCYWLCY
ncbi:UDP-N-acetylglucosamine transferase subunit ALG14 homolog isoform X2 [Siniperca chuatsi]|uniref:UDP-N-acetylglucosamine transferase subunit ALG14 homolog isoform X2 n=1 Tax=Siniperca chuatsi TaxID=119488 RepID=UPI001CE0B7DD|nr:UDP-N-acetylglucosamine transferase subunit ALG14 homolog isoform X2 [Siniperca chuatsi]